MKEECVTALVTTALEMDAHPLKILLQLQLASDSSAVLHLPHTLASLTAETLLPSAHTSKWTARINSLLHAKTSDARWAGLCLAHKSSLLSQAMMIECAQGWIGIALPLLAKKEATPVLSAAIHLLGLIFSSATNMHEFQRQVSTPNVLKFTTALISLGESHPDTELRILILATLTRLLPIYPTLHRANQTALSSLCFVFLNGNAFKPPHDNLVNAASELYATLHLTGGKVGAVNLWRKSVDDALSFGWTALSSLRTTFLVDGDFHFSYLNFAPKLRSGRLPQPPPGASEPLTWIPLNLDRLRCTIVVLQKLFLAAAQRPVQVPLGALVKFASALVACHEQDLGSGMPARVHFLPHLTCHIPRLLTSISFQLEQTHISSERLPFLEVVQVLLSDERTLHSTLIANRLAKIVLPLARVVLAREGDTRTTDSEVGQSKKGKKRAREFEGDEILRFSRDVICPTALDDGVLLAAFSVIRLLLRTTSLSPALQSIACRVALSALLSLPQMTPASLSNDPQLHCVLLDMIQRICVEFAVASVEGMSKSFGLIVGACLAGGTLSSELEILLHPRLPPLMRSMPGIEALSLSRAEESQEESDLLQSLKLVSPNTPTVEIPTSSGDPIVEAPAMNSVPREPPAVQIPTIPAPSFRPPTAIQAPAQPSTSSILRTQETPPLTMPRAIETRIEAPMEVEQDNDRNEEMPAIDLDSDSEEE
ncbi:RIX1 domain-containing protein [Mycena indigotica]|uniref:RIX1 domain-containing protein n=1 Tax=Mycena indigotica TaxID=2126181 RepID=A0A8H6W1S4_9AGAR|nr:RIX1 domain-containing protein [Mycena indigotica]KAF7301847.1 RIX1 domain-containing protein [Mycena indigotica]